MGTPELAVTARPVLRSPTEKGGRFGGELGAFPYPDHEHKAVPYGASKFKFRNRSVASIGWGSTFREYSFLRDWDRSNCPHFGPILIARGAFRNVNTDRERIANLNSLHIRTTLSKWLRFRIWLETTLNSILWVATSWQSVDISYYYA